MEHLEIGPVGTMEDLRAFWSVDVAVHEQDFVALPADPLEGLVPLLDGQPRAGELVQLHLARLGEDRVASLTVTLPILDNLAVAHIGAAVHPTYRRRGIGRQLLAAGVAAARQNGRTWVFITAAAPLAGGEGLGGPLRRSFGARPVLEEVRRLLDLAARPPGDPLPAPSGCRIAQWADRCPDELASGVAYLSGRMTTDSPMGERDYEPERWDVERYRDKEASAIARGRLRLATAVVHNATGALAGITDIGINRGSPEVAYQGDTIVDPDHRGWGLGLVLKAANHAQLVATMPAARWVNTWNAASNVHMVRVNEALGFQPVDRWLEWQLDL